MIYAIFFGGVGLGLIVWGIQFFGVGWLIVWLGMSFMVVGCSYAINRADGFGKSAQGTRSWQASLLLMPYLSATWLLWRAMRQHDAQPCWHQITDRLWLGRRPMVKELPLGIDLVVDLTCEFTRQKQLKIPYLTLPILDYAVPSLSEFEQLIERLADFSGNIYIHCAAGRSRSAMLLAALLIKQGRFSTPQAAVAYIHSIRCCVELTKGQTKFLTAWFAQQHPINPA
jgi:protein-tyrosine phosphatase